jgi:undecaprenyl-diphosphatase
MSAHSVNRSEPDIEAPSRRHHLALATAIGGGIALIAALMAELGADEDLAIDHVIRDLLECRGHPRTRATLRVVGTAGTAGVYLPAMLVASAVVARRRDRARAAPIPAAVLGAVGASWLLKRMVRRPRPVPRSGPVNERPSFPSGHATRASAMTLIIAYVLTRERLVPATVAMPAALALTAAVGASRAYADAHWTTDVIAGWALGGAAAGAAAVWYEQLRTRGFT